MTEEGFSSEAELLQYSSSEAIIFFERPANGSLAGSREVYNRRLKCPRDSLSSILP